MTDTAPLEGTDRTPTKPARRSLARELRVPTNPQYDHDAAPEENEFAFWNPVTATNKLVMLANSDLELTEAVADAMRQRNGHRLLLEEAERELEGLERELLATQPLGNAESKNNKTTAAAVYARAVDTGRKAAYDALQTRVATHRTAVTKLTGQIDRWMAWIQASERVGRHLQTALSFWKAEYGRAGRGT